MALGADQRAHITLADLGDIDARGGKTAFEILAGKSEVAGLAVVTVGAADGVHHLAAVFGPFAGEVFLLSDLLHQPGHIG